MKLRQLVGYIDPNIWLVLLFSIFAWAPLLTPAYFFEAHDAKHSIFFLVEFDQTFRDGFWWPRWSPDFAFGFGYPLFNLYAPLAFYLAELLHLIGFSFTSAIKTMYVLATIGAGLGMYGYVRHLFGSQAGLLAATVFMYAPFHLVEIFVRSAYAEFVALALIPLLFWSFTNLITAPNLGRIGLAGFAYGVVALSHHSTFFTFSPFLIVYVIFLILVEAKLNLRTIIVRALYAGSAGLLGLALAAIYLIPLITEMQYVKVEQWTTGSYNYLQHFVYFSQLLSPFWGFGYAGPGLVDDFSYQLGIVVIVLTIFALASLPHRRVQHYGTGLFFLISTLAIIMLMSPMAETLWQIIPIASLVQFPWRLLGMAVFTLSVVAGSLLALPATPLPVTDDQRAPVDRHPAPSPLFLLILVIILASYSYTLPQYTEVPEWSETPLAVVNWDRGSIIDRVGMVSVTEVQPQTSPMEQEYRTLGFPKTVAGITEGYGVVETLHHGGGSDKVRVVSKEPVSVQFYTYDYPGWQVILNNHPIEHRNEPPFGLITVDLPPGDHTLLLRMEGTLFRTVSTVVTILALLMIIGFTFVSIPARIRARFDN